MRRDRVSRLCSLELAVGRAEVCPQEGCSFWEPGGAALEGRCALERIDLVRHGSVVGLLLELRERLDSANTVDEAQAELSRLRHLLNESFE